MPIIIQLKNLSEEEYDIHKDFRAGGMTQDEYHQALDDYRRNHPHEYEGHQGSLGGWRGSSRRPRRAPEVKHPHAVHIDGKKWKTFSSHSHASNVARKILQRNKKAKIEIVKESEEYMPILLQRKNLDEGVGSVVARIARAVASRMARNKTAAIPVGNKVDREWALKQINKNPLSTSATRRNPEAMDARMRAAVTQKPEDYWRAGELSTNPFTKQTLQGRARQMGYPHPVKESLEYIEELRGSYERYRMKIEAHKAAVEKAKKEGKPIPEMPATGMNRWKKLKKGETKGLKENYLELVTTRFNELKEVNGQPPKKVASDTTDKGYGHYRKWGAPNDSVQTGTSSISRDHAMATASGKLFKKRISDRGGRMYVSKDDNGTWTATLDARKTP